MVNTLYVLISRQHSQKDEDENKEKLTEAK